MKAVDSSNSKNYLTKAENSLRIAKLAFDHGAYDSTVMNSIHSAINSLDALTTAILGKRSSGQHTDVLSLIKSIFSGKEHADISK